MEIPGFFGSSVGSCDISLDAVLGEDVLLKQMPERAPGILVEWTPERAHAV